MHTCSESVTVLMSFRSRTDMSSCFAIVLIQSIWSFISAEACAYTPS